MRLTIATISLLAFLSTNLQAQWSPGVYMKQATTRALAIAKLTEESSSTMGFKNGLCFMGTLLAANGGYSDFDIYLDADTRYIFIGGGDDDVTDIDIKIMNSYGTVLAQDTKTDNYPVVEFTPSRSGSYTLRLINLTNAVAFSALAMLQSGGVGLPVDNISETVEKIFKMCNAINSETSNKVWFLDLKGQWCFYGYVLDYKDKQTVTNIFMGGGKRYIMAAADGNASDIDACLTSGDGQTSYSCDTESDPTPIVTYRTSAYNKYGIKLSNVQSNGKTFILSCILKEDD